ncbi:MAG: ribosome silencing factor [Deltaproteobacteria bacterium]|nr:ribosome silencing factor [Deltaproteobacteria bacterium]
MEKKGEGLVVLNVRKLSSIADYIIICSAASERQVQAIALHVEETLRDKEEPPLSIEGLDSGRWVLMDYADVIAHVFLEPVRSFYDIEGLWADAPRVAVKEKRKKAV